MTVVLILVVVLALAAVAGVYLLGDSGYVLINFGDFIVEMSMVTLIGVAVLGAIGLTVLWRLLRGGWRAPASIRRAVRQRRTERARSTFLLGMQRLAEGRLADAEVELVRRAAHHDFALLNYLWAAEAADGVGAADRRDRYLELAFAAEPSSELAVLIRQADLQAAGGRDAEALASLLRLRELHPHHPGVLARLVSLYERGGDDEPLRVLLDQIAGERIIPEDRWQTLMRRCYIALIRDAGTHGRVDSLHGAWETVGKPFRSDPEVRRTYARQLAHAGANGEAIALITRVLDREWDAELVLIFGELRASDPLSQLASVEQWLREYDDRPELLLVAGRLCLRNRLWGRARSYLDASLIARKAPDTLFALARLAEETSEPERARDLYRQGLELALQPHST